MIRARRCVLAAAHLVGLAGRLAAAQATRVVVTIEGCSTVQIEPTSLLARLRVELPSSVGSADIVLLDSLSSDGGRYAFRVRVACDADETGPTVVIELSSEPHAHVQVTIPLTDVAGGIRMRTLAIAVAVALPELAPDVFGGFLGGIGAAVVGSVVSQGVGIAIGAQDSFSF